LIQERIDVHSLNSIGLRLYKSHVGQPVIASNEVLRELVKEAASGVSGHKFSLHFLVTEWEQVVDAWQLQNWEAYRDVARLGRKTRLPEAQRTVLWAIFERVRAALRERKLITHAEIFSKLAVSLEKGKSQPFDFAVVDEAQDISVAHLRFFAAPRGRPPNAAGSLLHLCGPAPTDQPMQLLICAGKTLRRLGSPVPLARCADLPVQISVHKPPFQKLFSPLWLKIESARKPWSASRLNWLRG
jgi:hypothetical protein